MLKKTRLIYGLQIAQQRKRRGRTIHTIATLSMEQADNIQQVNRAVRQMDEATQAWRNRRQPAVRRRAPESASSPAVHSRWLQAACSWAYGPSHRFFSAGWMRLAAYIRVTSEICLATACVAVGPFRKTKALISRFDEAKTKNGASGRRSCVLRIGRGGRIRTDDPLPPRQMRYQAALRPD
jgi:hypothetical protein